MSQEPPNAVKGETLPSAVTALCGELNTKHHRYSCPFSGGFQFFSNDAHSTDSQSEAQSAVWRGASFLEIFRGTGNG